MATTGISQKLVQVKGRKFDDETGIFEGYAAVFGNIDSDGDVIEKGAFTKFLAGDWSRVKILALHNDGELPIGRPVELREDDIGLYIKAQISDTSLGRDIRKLLKDGVLDELSIGYVAVEFDFDGDGIRHLTEIILEEVSVVTWAANDEAKVFSVKGQKSEVSPDALEEIAAQLEQYAAALRRQAESLGGGEKAAGGNQRKSQYRLPGTLSGKSRTSSGQ